MIISRIVFMLGALVGAPLISCRTQGRPAAVAYPTLADSSVPTIMASGRHETLFWQSVVVAVLRQQAKPYPISKRNELADSVVALAIRARDLILVGTISGVGLPAGPHHPGKPDPRALEWLTRIHRESADDGARTTALDQMLRQPNPFRSVPYLRQVATARDDPTSMKALAAMIEFANIGQIGTPAERREVLRQLREMWDRKLVTNLSAMVVFRRFAGGQKWPGTGIGA